MAAQPDAALERLLCTSCALQRAAAAASTTARHQSGAGGGDRPAAAAPLCWPLVALLLELLASQPVNTELLFASRAGAAVRALLSSGGPGDPRGPRPPQQLAEAARAVLRHWQRVVFAEWRVRRQGRC
jgi:hypothetical protein